jgi:GNAT superfamily N-acetyltransferase
MAQREDRNPKPEIRLWRDDDSLSALTTLLNEAYRPLAEAGFRYVASWQDETVTRRRIGRGECWLALSEGEIIGTILLCMPPPHAVAPTYERPDLAMFQQFAVATAYQGQGLGGILLTRMEERARELGATELAFDTSEDAAELIAWYERRGYRFIEHCDWEVTNYRSVIYAKALAL